MINAGLPVLHVDLITLAADAGPRAREQVLAEAAHLAAIDVVRRVEAIEGEAKSDFDLALLFLLSDFAALEPFGTHADYVRFLQGTVAPSLSSFAGADVQLETLCEPALPCAALMALAAPAETYDFEVRSELEGWAAQAAAADQEPCLGLAIGERQRYRGLVTVTSEKQIALPPRPAGRFTPTIVLGKATRLA